jgi:hypothetical protein
MLGQVGFGSGDFCWKAAQTQTWPTTRRVLGQLWVSLPNYHPEQKPKMILIKSVWMALFSWRLLIWHVWIYDHLTCTYQFFWNKLFFFCPIFREKTPWWVLGLRNLAPRPRIPRISPIPKAPLGEMILMKRVWMSLKNVWIFPKTWILHYPPL